MPEPSAWFARAADVVSRLTDRWTKVGALAASEYRLSARMTTDADLLVEWREDLVPHLEAAGYELRVIAEPDDHPHLLISRGQLGDVDFMIPTIPYQELALDRGVANGHVLTVEDVLVHKVIAWRPRDRDDVASILAAGHAVDEAYVNEWTEAWDVADRWRRARAGDFAP